MTFALEIAVFFFIAVVGSVSLYRARKLRALEERADLICGVASEAHRESGRAPRWGAALAEWLDRQGFSFDRGGIGLFLVVAALPILASIPFLGWKAGLAIDATAIAIYFVIVKRRSRLRAQEFTQRLPEFLERVRRLTATGHTFSHAFVEAAESADPIVKAYIDPVIRRFKYGVALAGSLESLARQTEIMELHMLAAYVQANAKFGGRVSQTLASLIAQINNRHRLEREVKAATAETRASAIILFALTVLVIAVTSVLNPEYPRFFLHNSTGRWILVGIVAWPAIGVLVMRRILTLEF